MEGVHICITLQNTRIGLISQSCITPNLSSHRSPVKDSNIANIADM